MAIGYNPNNFMYKIKPYQIDSKNLPVDNYTLKFNNNEFYWIPITGGLTYKGSWNSLNNNPILVSGVGIIGDFYIVSVPTSGITILDGESDWDIGDYVTFDGVTWVKIPAPNIINVPVEITNDFTIVNFNTLYIVDTTSNDINITIPDADNNNGGRFIQIIKYNGNNSIIIQTTNEQYIGNYTTQTITQIGKGLTVTSNGSNNNYIITQDSRFLEGDFDGSLQYWNNSLAKWISTNNYLYFETGTNTFNINTSISSKIDTITNDIILDNTYYKILCDASFNNIIVTLPLAINNIGKEYLIKKIDLTSNVITIIPSGIDTIDSEEGIIINYKNDCYKVTSNGDNWFII